MKLGQAWGCRAKLIRMKKTLETAIFQNLQNLSEKLQDSKFIIYAYMQKQLFQSSWFVNNLLKLFCESWKVILFWKRNWFSCYFRMWNFHDQSPRKNTSSRVFIILPIQHWTEMFLLATIIRLFLPFPLSQFFSSLFFCKVRILWAVCWWANGHQCEREQDIKIIF